MTALIVGLGSAGRRHLANLARLVPDVDVTVWHQHSSLVDYPNDSAATSVRHVFNLQDAMVVPPQFAVIAGPSTGHVGTAQALADRGVHLLIEKPLSDRREGVGRLLADCRAKHLVLLVAYNYRFYAPLQVMRQAILEGSIGRALSVRAEVGQYLPDWRPAADYRRSVTARHELGGGVLLELSHEIDYVRWLIGEVAEVSARVGRLSDLDIDVEDTAELILGFASGAIGSIHLDMVQRAPTRSCKVVGTEGTLEWDGPSHRVRLYSAASRQWTDLCGPDMRDRNESYLVELRHYLECVRGAATPAVTGEDGLRVLDIVLAARQSSMEGRVVTV
jgi:predicted dehydrogenase